MQGICDVPTPLERILRQNLYPNDGMIHAVLEVRYFISSIVAVANSQISLMANLRRFHLFLYRKNAHQQKIILNILHF